MPEVPDVPLVPDVPEEPDVPLVPDVPEEPDVPLLPGEPTILRVNSSSKLGSVPPTPI